jgi:Uma2 family endonuclease
VARRTRARALHGADLTLAAWGELEEDIEGELVDGRLEEEEVPTFLHEVVVAWLIATLRSWAQKRGALVVGSEAKIAIGRRRGRKADVAVFTDAKPALQDTVALVAPHLVVEVISPRPRDARRDRVEKLKDYAAAGIRFYWLLDPGVRSLEILELDKRGRYVHVMSTSSGRLNRVPGCPGLSITLDRLWAELDAAEPDRPIDPGAKPAPVARGRNLRNR